jgi:hypothetical protein
VITISLSVTRGTTGIDSRRRWTVVRPCRCRRSRVGAEVSASSCFVGLAAFASDPWESGLALIGWSVFFDGSVFLRVVVLPDAALVES